MMDIELPSVDIDYDYMLELLITGEFKDRLKDTILSIPQMDTGIDLNPSMSALSIAAESMDENEIFGAISHLNEDEKRKILDVMKRAQLLDKEAASRSRQVSTEFVDQRSRTSSRQSSLDRHCYAVCPICVDVELQSDYGVPDGAMPTNFRQNVCAECAKTVCKDCGGFELHPRTKFQVWICKVCSKRKKPPLSNTVHHDGRTDDDYSPCYDYVDNYGYDHQQFVEMERRCSMDSCSSAQGPSLRRTPPNVSAFTPPTPESSSSRATRPNFLQISDSEYFGVAATSSSTASSSSSIGSSQHKQTAESKEAAADTSRCQPTHLSKQSNHKDNSADCSNVSGEEIQRLSAHRLDQQASSRLDSAEGGEHTGYRGTHPSYSSARHDVTNDYYLSEEDELSMIVHASKHGDVRSDEYYDEFAASEHHYGLPGSTAMPTAARIYPPHEWSPPITDLSPIEDVPSSIELEAEAEWLAYQRNDPGRRRHDNDYLGAKPQTRGHTDLRDSRFRHLSTEAEEFFHRHSLEAVQEQSSTEDCPLFLGRGKEELAEETSDLSCDKDKDSQTSTVESGYESQSRDQQTSAAPIPMPGPPCPPPRNLQRRYVAEHDSSAQSASVEMGRQDGSSGGRVLSIVTAFQNNSIDMANVDKAEGHLPCVSEKHMPRKLPSTTSVEEPYSDYGTDFEDGVPYVAEGTTYNIHGGRDMFAKQNLTRSAGRQNKPAIPKKPSLEKIARTRSFCKQSSVDPEATESRRADSVEVKGVSVDDVASHRLENRQLPGYDQPAYTSRASKSHRSEAERPAGEGSVTPPHVSVRTGPPVKHRQSQLSTPPGDSLLSPSASSTMSSASAKPIPAPRRKAADNSLIAKSSDNNNLESDDEIVEIRFDDGSSSAAVNQHNRRVKHGGKSSSSGGSISTKLTESKPSSRRTTRLHNTGRSVSVDFDAKTANIKRSMDELRRREEDENEKTKELEKRLDEIRRMEEKQRHILQSTLRQVLNSVSESQQGHSQTSPAHKDEIPINDSRIDCSSLLSPSFNRKTPLSSPLLTQRGTASPQSPRKLSSTGRRQDMQTINENGAYSMTELAAMSPASSHRTLSSMASPLIAPRQDYGSLGSQSLPPRHDRQHMGNPSLADPFTDQHFRLSTSYTELPPQFGDSSDRSGYFSDREADRRRGGDDLRNYTDSAREALLEMELEKRKQQLDENNELRVELQRLIQSGFIPKARYDRLCELYRDHIKRNQECLGLSNSSLSSISTGRNVRMGYDGFTTDSDFMSSSEQLAGTISQSSTVERFMQSSETLYRQSLASKSTYSTASGVSSHSSVSQGRPSRANSTMGPESGPSSRSSSLPPGRGIPPNDANMPAMPLLEIRAPKSSRASGDLVKIGEISHGASDASFDDPEELIVDAKLEGGKTIVRSKEKEASLKSLTPTAESMPVSRFNFPTKRILITPASTSKEKGLGLEIQGGLSVPHQNGVMGAFVQEIRPGSVAAQLLGELKPGDEIVEWNGVGLRNKADPLVQDVIAHWSGEIEITVRLDKQPFRLPRHQSSRIDYEGGAYQSTENVNMGFESPLSDKSWSKEFDESRQSTIRSRRGTIEGPSQAAPTLQHEPEIHDEFSRMPSRTDRPAKTELRDEQLQLTLEDMSERLDDMNRQPQSPQEEFARARKELSYPDSSVSASETDFPDSEVVRSDKMFSKVGHPAGRDVNLQRDHKLMEDQRESSVDSAVTSGSVTRSSSDMSANVLMERNRERVLAEQGARRMSHQDRLKHGPAPLSPRTGRHPNMQRLRECGELEAMFMYDYSRRLLVIRIERAVGLALAGEDKLNPFIKVHFLKNRHVTEKRCTRYIEATHHPKWEQSFTFHVEEDELNMHKIKMAAWNYFQPRQNMFIGSTTIDLSRQQHVDGNLRMYKLDSDSGERRDSGSSGTPFMPRVNRHDQSSNRQPQHNLTMSPSRSQRGEPPARAIPPKMHSSPHQSQSTHSSPRHFSPQHIVNNGSRRDVDTLSERSHSQGRESPSHHSYNSIRHSEDNSSRSNSIYQQSPHHVQQTPMVHSGTNGLSRNNGEINNNGIKAGHGVRRGQQQLRY